MLKLYIRQILNDVHPTLLISNDSYIIIGKNLIKILRELLLQYDYTSDFYITITDTMDENLANKATNDYRNFLNGNYELIYPIDVIDNIIENEKIFKGYIYPEEVLTFLSVMIEYLTLEILSLSGNATNDNKKMTIKPQFLYKAIKNNDELKNLLDKVFDEPLSAIIYDDEIF